MSFVIACSLKACFKTVRLPLNGRPNSTVTTTVMMASRTTAVDVAYGSFPHTYLLYFVVLLD